MHNLPAKTLKDFGINSDLDQKFTNAVQTAYHTEKFEDLDELIANLFQLKKTDQKKKVPPRWVVMKYYFEFSVLEVRDKQALEVFRQELEKRLIKPAGKLNQNIYYDSDRKWPFYRILEIFPEKPACEAILYALDKQLIRSLDETGDRFTIISAAAKYGNIALLKALGEQGIDIYSATRHPSDERLSQTMPLAAAALGNQKEAFLYLERDRDYSKLTQREASTVLGFLVRNIQEGGESFSQEEVLERVKRHKAVFLGQVQSIAKVGSSGVNFQKEPILFLEGLTGQLPMWTILKSKVMKEILEMYYEEIPVDLDENFKNRILDCLFHLYLKKNQDEGEATEGILDEQESENFEILIRDFLDSELIIKSHNYSLNLPGKVCVTKSLLALVLEGKDSDTFLEICQKLKPLFKTNRVFGVKLQNKKQKQHMRIYTYLLKACIDKITENDTCNTFLGHLIKQGIYVPPKEKEALLGAAITIKDRIKSDRIIDLLKQIPDVEVEYEYYLTRMFVKGVRYCARALESLALLYGYVFDRAMLYYKGYCHPEIRKDKDWDGEFMVCLLDGRYNLKHTHNKVSLISRTTEKPLREGETLVLPLINQLKQRLEVRADYTQYKFEKELINAGIPYSLKPAMIS